MAFLFIYPGLFTVRRSLNSARLKLIPCRPVSKRSFGCTHRRSSRFVSVNEDLPLPPLATGSQSQSTPSPTGRCVLDFAAVSPLCK